MRKAIALLALLTAVSCGDDIEKRFAKASAGLKPTVPPPGAASSDPAARVGATWLSSWDIGNDRKVLMKYSIGSGNTHVLKGTPRTDDERDYAVDDSTSPVVTAKRQEDAFRILTPPGTLRWKVKLDGDRIKISDNDQNANAYVMKTAGQVTTVTAPDGRVMGTVKYESGRDIVRDGLGKVVQRMPSKVFRPAYGTLLVDGMLPPERYATLAELIDLMPSIDASKSPTQPGGTYFDSWQFDDADAVTIKYAAAAQNHVLHGQPLPNGRDYRLDDGPVFAHVRKDQDGLVLTNAAGEARWSIRVNGNTARFEAAGVKDVATIVTNGNEATVTSAGTVVGTVTFDGTRVISRDAAGHTVDSMPSNKMRAAFGVLLVDGIAPEERYILLAEILDATR